MRPAAFTIAGGLVGAIGAVVLIYLLGALLQGAGLQLYASEADQQRNFNLALMFTGGLAALGGWLGYRRGRGDA